MPGQKTISAGFSVNVVEKGPAGTQTEHRYKSTNSSTAPSIGDVSTWSTSETAVTTSARYRWRITRTRASDESAWGSWTGPVLDYYLQEDGAPAQMYMLEAVPSSAVFRSNATGEFSPGSVIVSCSVRKIVGDAMTTISLSNLENEGLALYYVKSGASAVYQPYTGGVPVTKEEAMASQNAVTAVKFKLTKSSSYSTVLKELTVPVVCDGRIGATGATGRMFYPMGEWNPDTTYEKTGEAVPLVHLDDGVYNADIGAYGHYWYLTAASAQGNSQKPQDNSEYWRKCDDFGVVITQGLFAEFAKLGKAIMSGDYMFSMNGRIGGTEYNAGAYVTGTIPAYTWFQGDPEYTVDYSTLKGIYAYGYINFGREVQMLAAGSKTTKLEGTARIVRTTAEADTSDRVYLELIDVSTGNQLYFYANGVSTNAFRITSTEQTVTLSYTASSSRTVRWKIHNTYSAMVRLHAGLDMKMTGFFEPNWWVDLLTGKMVAARGNFVVKPDGSVDVEGTIKANNLFRTTAMVWGGNERSVRLLKMGGSINFFGSGSTTAWCWVKKIETDYAEALADMYGLKVGDYVEMTKDRYEANQGYWEDAIDQANFIVCTYNADIVTGIRMSTGNNYVKLPCAKDFAGKTVEVNNATSSSDQSASSKVLKVGAADDVYIHWSPQLSKQTGAGGSFSAYGFNLIFESGNLSQYFNVGAGRTVLFYSNGEFWICMKNENNAT